VTQSIKYYGICRQSRKNINHHAVAKEWVAKYPIILWEDPLAEGDWDGFRQFTEEIACWKLNSCWEMMPAISGNYFATAP